MILKHFTVNVRNVRVKKKKNIRNNWNLKPSHTMSLKQRPCIYSIWMRSCTGLYMLHKPQAYFFFSSTLYRTTLDCTVMSVLGYALLVSMYATSKKMRGKCSSCQKVVFNQATTVTKCVVNISPKYRPVFVSMISSHLCEANVLIRPSVWRRGSDWITSDVISH